MYLNRAHAVNSLPTHCTPSHWLICNQCRLVEYCKTHNFGTLVYWIILAPLILAFLVAELILIVIIIIQLVILSIRYFHDGTKVTKFAKWKTHGKSTGFIVACMKSLLIKKVVQFVECESLFNEHDALSFMLYYFVVCLTVLTLLYNRFNRYTPSCVFSLSLQFFVATITCWVVKLFSFLSPVSQNHQHKASVSWNPSSFSLYCPLRQTPLPFPSKTLWFGALSLQLMKTLLFSQH